MSRRIDAFSSERLIIRSIGQRALVFGECESAGMVARNANPDVLYSLDDCGILLDAEMAVLVLNRKFNGYGTCSL